MEEFPKTINRIREKARKENRLLDNPPDELLRRLVEKEAKIKRTIYDNFVAESEPTSRSAMFTKNSIDTSFGKEELELLSKCERTLAKEKLISIDRIVGNQNSKTTARLIVPERFAHVAYGGRNLFLPVKQKVEEPTYLIVFFADEAFETNKSKPLPQKDITVRLAMLPTGRFVKLIRNCSYIGEYKKGIFAAEDWFAKTKRGGIFLHAGCREDYLQSTEGDYRTTRTLFLALSANGKTTLTCKILARKGKEKSWLVQDDGGTLMPDGSFHGFEAGGLFVKTEGVGPEGQIEIYYGLLKPKTLLENVFVNGDGEFDFYNLEKTSNGRAVIQRDDFMHASPYIDIPQVDNIILITRGSIIPAISKLNLEQAVALMIVGLAMESSAGDPTKAGTIRSTFFYDPFVAGDRAEHANRFYEILKGLPHINYYLLNTGWIGEGARLRDVRLEYTIAILDSLLRHGLESPTDWIDSRTGFKVPKAVRLLDDIYLHPEKLYSSAEFARRQIELNTARRAAIAAVGPRLHPEVRKCFDTSDEDVALSASLLGKREENELDNE